jgi:hypothetical protein
MADYESWKKNYEALTPDKQQKYNDVVNKA